MKKARVKKLVQGFGKTCAFRGMDAASSHSKEVGPNPNIALR